MGQGHTRNFIPKRLLSWEPATSVGKKVRKHLHIAKCAGSTGGACVCVCVGVGVCVYTLYLYVHRCLCARESLSGDIYRTTARMKGGAGVCVLACEGESQKRDIPSFLRLHP